MDNSMEIFIGKIMTVSGPIAPDEMGFTLPHEHVMSTFGAESARFATVKTIGIRIEAAQ